MLPAKSAREIYEKYPKQFPKNSIDCNTGWLKIIDEMCATIQIYIDFEIGDKVSQVEFVEIIESHGVLDIVYTGGDKVVKHVVELCKRLSYKTCEYCGKIGNLYCSTKWRKWSNTKTLCEKHAIEFFYYRLTVKEP